MTETEIIDVHWKARTLAVANLVAAFSLNRSEREIANAESLFALWQLIRGGKVTAATDFKLVRWMVYCDLIDGFKQWRPGVERRVSTGEWVRREEIGIFAGAGCEDEDVPSPHRPDDTPTVEEVRRLLGQYIPAEHLECVCSTIGGEAYKVTAARIGRTEGYVARLVMEARIKLNARHGIIRRRLGI